MDRTVPSRGNDEIALYIRTYYSLLRSSHKVKLKTLIEAHTRTHSALHAGAGDAHPDMGAFIYAVLRIPSCLLDQVKLIILGQSIQRFTRYGYADIESWQRVGQPARRRPAFFDGNKTLAVYINSRSDIDDLIPILMAYQIERGKMHRILNQPNSMDLLRQRQDQVLSKADLNDLEMMTQIPADDLERLCRIWQEKTANFLLLIAQKRLSLSVRLLGGSFVDYSRATRNWWDNVETQAADIDFENRPIYFVSSNTHSLANVLSGYALQETEMLIRYIQTSGDAHLQQEYDDILSKAVPSNRENFLYYTLKKYEAQYSHIQQERERHEQNASILRIPSQASYDIEAQVIPLNQINPQWIDPRLRVANIEKLQQSSALLFNIDYPLGMAAYHLLSQIARHTSQVLGVYITGKAATLNARIGDVMIPKVVHDEQSDNTYLFNNCFTADDIVPYLTYGNVLDNQKAITVRGTFLQNENYMGVFYNEGYTDVEMEAGPYLSCIYELVRPQRYPKNELVNLYEAPFPVGCLHYASDTPLSKGKNLGSQNLSYFGMDPTYATMVAIARAIFQTEIKRLEATQTED